MGHRSFDVEEKIYGTQICRMDTDSCFWIYGTQIYRMDTDSSLGFWDTDSQDEHGFFFFLFLICVICEICVLFFNPIQVAFALVVVGFALDLGFGAEACPERSSLPLRAGQGCEGSATIQLRRGWPSDLA